MWCELDIKSASYKVHQPLASKSGIMVHRSFKILSSGDVDVTKSHLS